MPRATTKADLVKMANEEFDKMFKIINSMSSEKQLEEFKFGAEVGSEAHWSRDRNIRDVLVHLYEWHQLLLSFVKSNLNGIPAPFLPLPYTWKTYSEMNVELWKKHQATSYETSKEMLKESHEKVMALLEKFSDTELFEKKHYNFTGTSSLGQYFISAAPSHYDWAIKKLKKNLK